MYNIDMYTYWKKPFTIVRKYGIHPLDDPGVEKYYGPESHVVNYLSRINPKVLKNIIGEDYETVIEKQKEKIREQKEGKAKQENDIGVETKSALNETQNLKTTKKVSIDANPEIVPNQTENNQNEPEPEHDVLNQNTTNFFPGHRTTGSHNFLTGYHRRRNFKDNYGYEQGVALKTNKDKYLNDIKTLKKEKLANNEFNYTHSGSFYPKKRYSGFTSYAVPRTDKPGEQSNAFKNFTSRINKSISTNTARNLNDFELMENDNNRLRTTLYNQTNRNFLTKNELPDLGTIANTRKKIRNIRIGNSKEMGEKYDPFCHIPNTGNRVGRNFVGALFQH